MGLKENQNWSMKKCTHIYGLLGSCFLCPDRRDQCGVLKIQRSFRVERLWEFIKFSDFCSRIEFSTGGYCLFSREVFDEDDNLIRSFYFPNFPRLRVKTGSMLLYCIQICNYHFEKILNGLDFFLKNRGLGYAYELGCLNYKSSGLMCNSCDIEICFWRNGNTNHDK